MTQSLSMIALGVRDYDEAIAFYCDILGFTLIELMMVVMIAAVLAAVAVPAYTSYIARGKVAQVTGALSEAKVRMEQSFNSVRTYATTPGGQDCAADLFVPLFPDTAFSVAVSAC